MILFSSVSALSIAYAASAETVNPSAQSVLSTMNTSGGSEALQWQVAPTYSELFGLGVRGTVGGYVNEDFALGVIIDYAEHREEYLANAGFRLNDNMRVIGSVGILKESEEFTLGDGREDVSQLEYGLSLKGNYEAGLVRGFEINAYHTNGKSDTDAVETGDLTGLQVVTQLKPSDSTDLRLGAGYEKAEWDGGDVDEGFTFQALGSQKLSDALALNFEVKSAETENVYGLGFTYDMATADIRNSSLSINFDKIEGKHGISDDTRVALNWTVGFGAASGAGAGGSDATVSSMGSIARADLLADVMTRPAFLPERVLARAGTEDVCDFTASYYGATMSGTTLETIQVTDLRDSEGLLIGDIETEGLEATIVSATISVNGVFASSYDGNQVFYSYPGIGFHLNPPIQNIEGETVQIVFSTSDSQTVCYEDITFSAN